MMHSPLFQISPYFRKNFQTLWKFSRKLSRFPSAKISNDLFFLSHRPQISNFPLFSPFQYISPLFRENYYFLPTSKNFPSVLEKFMHHPMHVLDAPVY